MMRVYQENASDSPLNVGLKQKQRNKDWNKERKQESKSGNSVAEVWNNQNTLGRVSENSALLQGEY